MKKIIPIAILIISLSFFSCTTSKNTATTRTYHNVTSHFNVYFNGNESFNSGIVKVEENYDDNYLILLPVFKYSVDEAVKHASSDMDRTLIKMGKTISVHSITVKPKIKGTMTSKDKEFMKQTEYCKWIDDSYLFIGKADFYKRDYSKALRAFRRIINQYKYEESRFEAQLWIAKVYIEQEKYQDAFNYLTELENDVRHPKKLNKEINLTFADYYIRKEEYSKAIDRLLIGIDLTRKRDEKARYYFILAQLEQELGNNTASSDYFKKVIKLNPNYDMVFSAKIMRATVFDAGQDSKDIKKQLRKMLRDEKNEEYKDQIYYAYATIEQKEGNEPEAIKYYKLSASSSVSNDNQKAFSFLALADIYFLKKDFMPSGKYYDSTMQYLDINYPDYNSISLKAENTGYLVEHLTIVQEQDSLQKIANMSEKDRLAFIDNLIKEVKAREAAMQQDDMNNYYDPNDFINDGNNNSKQGGKWYMYNPVLVSRGQNEFKKIWGNRELEDNWRRRNKASTNNFDNGDPDEVVDSTIVTDNKTREYYLQNLPLTDSLMKISDSLIVNSLFNAAEVYEYRLLDNNAAIKTYDDLMVRFPENYLKLETYYRLHKLNNKISDKNKADYYKEVIVLQYPNSKYAKMLQDPNFFAKLMATEKEALNLYDRALSEYKNGNYYQSLTLSIQGLTKYPDSQAYPNFLFIKAQSYGGLGQMDSLKTYLQKVTLGFPKFDIGKLAAEIIVLIESGKYDFDIYNHLPNEKHYYIVILKNSLNTEEFRFKLKLKAEQFTNTKTFEINHTNFSGNLSIITIQTFDDLQESELFYKTVLGSNIFDDFNEDEYHDYFISKSNYNLFLKDKMIEKYEMFFSKKYSFSVQ